MKIRVLGTAQDAGSPRPGCDCPQCEQGLFRHGPSVLVESAEGSLLVDAPPDVRRTGGLERTDEIALTHAHVGHYAGLLFLGREARDADRVPLHCSEATAEWFRGGNKAYHHLVARGNVELWPFAPGESVEICSLTCTPVEVPHRNEDADTVALRFEDGDSQFCYLPDLDYWTDAAETAVRESDAALVDGTFYTDDELDGRSMDEVPHPRIPTTMDRLADADVDVYFTHLNHTNPAADPESDARRTITDRGFAVADDGLVMDLGD